MYGLGQVLQHRKRDEYVIYCGFNDDWVWLFWNPERGYFFGDHTLQDEYIPVYAKTGRIIAGKFCIRAYFGWLAIEKFKEKKLKQMAEAIEEVRKEHLTEGTGKNIIEGSESPGYELVALK